MSEMLNRESDKCIKIVWFIIIFFCSCSDSDNDSDNINDKHTVIIYMIANNDLYNDALEDINEMEKAWNANYNGNIIIIIKPKSQNKDIYVLEIAHDDDLDNISSPTIEIYNDRDCIDPYDINYILEDVIKRYPSKNYSLVLWSHATAWLPPNTITTYSKDTHIRTKNKSFGLSEGSQVDIKNLSISLPSNLFDLIIFDACFMGSIEALYEIKEKANYFIASPAEILSEGFPYKKIIPLLFSREIDAIKIAKSFMSFYESLEREYNSATIGVIKASELTLLAQKTKKIIDESDNPLSEIIENIDKIQYYDRFQKKKFYDYKQVMNFVENRNKNSLIQFEEQFYKTVIFSSHTKWFANELELKECHGLSCYIPNDENSDLNKYYLTLSWCRDSGFYNLFKTMN